jgi:hypothetical protein
LFRTAQGDARARKVARAYKQQFFASFFSNKEVLPLPFVRYWVPPYQAAPRTAKVKGTSLKRHLG